MHSEPKAKEIVKLMSNHGIEREDPYYWMNERDSPEVLAYLDSENRWAEATMAATTKLRQELFAEMKARVKEDEQSTPVLRHGYYYYRRYIKGGSTQFTADGNGIWQLLSRCCSM